MLFFLLFIIAFILANVSCNRCFPYSNTYNLGSATSPLQLAYPSSACMKITDHLVAKYAANFTITVPPNLMAESITITLYGSPGQDGPGSCPGGKGQSVSVTFKPNKVLKTSQSFYIFVNNDGGNRESDETTNSGGGGFSSAGCSVDIRYPGYNLNDRILVAPGGGGGGNAAINTVCPGGDAGGDPMIFTNNPSFGTGYGSGETPTCQNGCATSGGGATPYSGGAGGNCDTCAECNKLCDTYLYNYGNKCVYAGDGTFGYGGQGYDSKDSGNPGGSGGGGWYGGGGGVDCGGGGGSSYISPKFYNKLKSPPIWSSNTAVGTVIERGTINIGYATISWTGAESVPTAEPTSSAPTTPPVTKKPSISPTTTPPTFTSTTMPTTVVYTFTYNEYGINSPPYSVPGGAVSVSFIAVGASGGLAYANKSLSSVAKGGLAGVVQGEIDLSNLPIQPSNQPVSIQILLGGSPLQNYCRYQTNQIPRCVYVGAYAGETNGGAYGGTSGGAGGGGETQISMRYYTSSTSSQGVSIAVAPGGGGGGFNGLGSPCPGGNGQSDSSGIGSSAPICPVPLASGVDNTCPSTGGNQTHGGSCVNSCWPINGNKAPGCNGKVFAGGEGGGAGEGSTAGTKAQYGSGGGGGYFGGAGGTSVYNPYLNQYLGGPGAGGSSYSNPAYVSNVQYSAASGPGNGWIQLVSNYPTNIATVTVVVSGTASTNPTQTRLRNGVDKLQEVPDTLLHLVKNWMYVFLQNGKFKKFAVSPKKSKVKKDSIKVTLHIGTRDANLLQQIKEFISDTRNDDTRNGLFQNLLNSSDMKDLKLSIESLRLVH